MKLERVRALRSRRSWAHCVDADTAWTILSRPRFGQQIDGGLTRAVEAHTGDPIIGNHCRYIDDCSLASLRHQWSKLRDEEVWRLDVQRIHRIKLFLRRFIRRPEREDASIVNQNIDVPVSELDCSFRHFASARRTLKVG